MTLEYLLLDLPPIGELQQLYLVFDSAINTELLVIQENNFSNNQNKIATLQLTNGQYMLCADILTEVEDGIYSGGFSLVPTELYPLVQVITLEELMPLLPVSDAV